MELKAHKKIINVGGETITFETGKVARQANGAVMVQMGETIVFATACSATTPQENHDFLPLRVDYQEKFSAAGKTLGGFIKREGRPSEREILVSRLIDRPMRPMFPEGYSYEVQLLAYVLSYDGINAPDHLAICATSAALVVSDIPFPQPVAGVRVGMIDGKFVVNPTIEAMNQSKLDLMLAGTESAILMIEGHCDFLTEEQLLEALAIGHEAIATICRGLNEWRAEVGKAKNNLRLFTVDSLLVEEVEKRGAAFFKTALSIADKHERQVAIHEAKEVTWKAINEAYPDKWIASDFARAWKQREAAHMRQMILDTNARCDGRKVTEIRPICIEQSVLPRAHGSSLFTRGETQALAVCTLGGEAMGQRFESLEGDGLARFYLQYSFPPFSVGEVNRVGAPGRREVGHGKLAERALKAILPSVDQFPYVIRLESNITESNGSSSMASVCGGALALMNAGVPLKRPISGIAMGLILEKDRYVILSDILGIEDALGDMDFKVTGDAEGITAFQMDIKVEGITQEIMRAALMQAKAGRIHILQKMLQVCPHANTDLSRYAPRIETMMVNPSKIGALIGPGGKEVKRIIAETGVEIDIDDSGRVNISSTSAEAMNRAKAMVRGLVAEVEVGQIYEGKVTSIMPFGMFVEVLPGKEGLCHISEIDHIRIQNVSDHIKEGQEVRVKVLEINERGQYKLSRKALLPVPARPPRDAGRDSKQESAPSA